ncbi:hypothetical protein SAMN05444166_0435 [Singulisphaera sp. GP187]|uniref:hypothetical protein n=1 Tax=Singulisphaera sp. GP187 TaxID=1882752 RepID=UPI000928EEE6|nr:hypothetical protein [Singulisphaera sp. GP187]SIN72283.1 hypothetical protein SAMN05444166_0435 [Singulisphaera sp. GP187]
MAIQLRLSKTQISDLKAIVELGSETLNRLAEQIETVTPPPFSPPELNRVVTETIRENPEAVDPVTRQLLSFASLRRRRGLEVDDVLSGLKAALRDSGTEVAAAWEGTEAAFRRLLSSGRIATIAKALDLSYDYENLVQSARIVTDVRPVFDDELSRIDGAVVSFTLRLKYVSLEGDNGISLAMDKGDVEMLLRECERALQKATLATETLSKLPIRTLISGAGTHE